MSKQYWIYNCIVASCLFCIMVVGFAITKYSTNITVVISTVFAFWSVTQFLIRKRNNVFENGIYSKYKALDFAITTTLVNIIVALLVHDYCRWLPEEIRWYCTIALVLTLSAVSAVFVLKEENISSQ